MRDAPSVCGGMAGLDGSNEAEGHCAGTRHLTEEEQVLALLALLRNEQNTCRLDVLPFP